ncbi:MAG TPA: molybdopterin-dependent oxidoreductase [Terriglobales bacterium]
MRLKTFLTRLPLALVLFASVAGCQSITIQAESGKPAVFTRADIESLPHQKIATAPGDKPASYDGVALKDVLQKAGVELGDSLKGKRLASYLLVEAADDYRVVIALPELDPAFNNKQFFLVYSRDGQPLDAKEGPYRIVIPDEKRMARWVRQVTALKIVDVQ